MSDAIREYLPWLLSCLSLLMSVLTGNETVPLERQVACVRREVSMRRRVYPRWVSTGRMTQVQADREITVMEAAQATLEQLLAERKAVTSPGLF